MKSKTAILIAAIATRFIPHLPNFTAIGATALFAGVVFKDQIKAFLVPFAALFLSDLVINNVIYATYNEGFTLFTKGFGYIYFAFFLTVLIGQIGIKKINTKHLLGAGLSSAVLFYLLTNFGAWLGNPLYAQNFSGLLMSYAVGLPFLLNQVLGTVFYGAILFGSAYVFAGYRFRSVASA